VRREDLEAAGAILHQLESEIAGTGWA